MKLAVAQVAASRQSVILEYLRLKEADPKLSMVSAARLLGVNNVTLTHWLARYQAEGFEGLAPRLDKCGRKPAHPPTQHEISVVKALLIRLDSGVARGRGQGSSVIQAFRLAAHSDDPLISENFRRVVLHSDRKRKSVPESWRKLVEMPAAVLAAHRDSATTATTYISTPRGRHIIGADGEAAALRAGDWFEADDGTPNFYCWIDWPYGGDPCSEKYGVKLGRWQLLPVVDRATWFIVGFDIVARPLGSYRANDVVAVLGRIMLQIGVPAVWCLERGSWESHAVTDLLKLAGCTVKRAWESKHKAPVEGTFNRLWTPMSLIHGHVGRDQGRMDKCQTLALQCQSGAKDPKNYFLSLADAMPQIVKCVRIQNAEPVESADWGSWVPVERWERQIAERPMRKLAASLGLFYQREQRDLTVQAGGIKARVASPLIDFPIHFQDRALWEFNGCKVRAYFDPYAQPPVATLVLQEESWRTYKRGHVIAQDVPATERPPLAVLTENYVRTPGEQRSLDERKALGAAVTREKWNYLGERQTERPAPLQIGSSRGDEALTPPPQPTRAIAAPPPPAAAYEREITFTDD